MGWIFNSLQVCKKKKIKQLKFLIKEVQNPRPAIKPLLTRGIQALRDGPDYRNVQILLSDRGIQALRDHLITLEQIASMPHYRNVQYFCNTTTYVIDID